MDNTQIKVDEPRKDECEAYRVVLLDGERNNVKQSGETGVRIVRMGGPEIYVKEPGKVSVPDTPIATVSQKWTEGEPQKEGVIGHLQSNGRLPSGKRIERGKSPVPSEKTGGVRVVDLAFRGKASTMDRRRQESPSGTKTPSGEDKASDKEAEKAKAKADSKVREEKRLRRDLNNSIAEGSFTTASSSIVSSYTTPFALALNASNSEIGLLTSVQNLAGILSQLPGARLTKSMTRKKIWVLTTVISRLFLIPLIFIGMFSPSTEIWVLIVLLGLVSFFSTMRGPAWSSMMGDIVPQDRRGRYFGKRNMIIGFAGMVATLGAGAAIYYWGFHAIFAVAVVLTGLSVMFFVRMREPELRQERAYHYRMHFHPADLVYQIKTNRNFAIFTVYMTVVNFGVNIAAPFAAVYMLKNLDVGYAWFAVLVTIGALVQLLSMKYWGGRCDRYGNRRILVISGILICFVPLGYMLSTNVWHLVLLKIYDGFVWGAFDLVVFNYLLSITPSEKRPGFVANHNFLTGAGTVLGALFGAFLSEQFQAGGFWIYGLQAVFLISFILRVSSIAFLPKIAEVEVKQDECVPVRYIFWDTVAIGPAKGVEHAISSAFRYPYGVKIKSKLGLNNNRKIKLSTKSFGKKDSWNPGTKGDNFQHGVLPAKERVVRWIKERKWGV